MQETAEHKENDLAFTGERFVPTLIEKYIVAEHLQRYHAVLDLVRGKKVLDAACGTGYGTALMASVAAEATGVDISAEAVQYAKRRYASCGNAHYLEASVDALPFPDHSFDVIVSFETIEHVPEEVQNRFLREIKRCLKEDGLLVMSSPDKRTYSDLPGFHNEFHVREFYVEEFEAFLQQEFRYCVHYLQGEQSLSGEVIHAAQGESSALRVLNKMEYHRDKDLYEISVCSNAPLEGRPHDLSSIFAYEYVPTAYTFVDQTYTPEHIIYPAAFEEDDVCTVRFDLTGRETEGRVRFDPLENACCTVELLEVHTDAEKPRVASLNHIRQEGDAYTFVTIDPIIEIFGDFSRATYLEIRYRLRTLDTKTVSVLANQKIEAEQKALSARQRELEAKQRELADLLQAFEDKQRELADTQKALVADQRELQDCRDRLAETTRERDGLQQEMERIKSTRGYRALEKLRAARRSVLGK